MQHDRTGATGMTSRGVRFRDAAWQAICCEATSGGMSAAEFVRDAALARAVASYQARGGEGNAALDAILGAPREPSTPATTKPATRKPLDAKAAYARLMDAAKAGLEVHELVPKERRDLMTIFRMAEARGGYTHRRAERVLGEAVS